MPATYLKQGALWILTLALTHTALADDSRAQMLKRLELLQQLDSITFTEGVEKANTCTSQRNFSCADTQLDTIKPLIQSDSENRLYQMALSNLNSEKAQAETERRLAQEERDRQRRAEEQRIAAIEAEERRLEREREEEERRRAIQYGMNSLAIGLAAKDMSNEQVNRLIEANARDYEQGSGTSNLQASLDHMKQENQQRHLENQRLIQQQREQRQREQEAMERALAEQREVQQRQTENSARQQQALVTQQEQQRQQEAELKRQAQERANKEAETARKEQERQQRIDQEKAEREAQKAAEQAERDRLNAEYLTQTAQGIRLAAIKCFGETHVVGTRPSIKTPSSGHSCIDVSFSVRCPSSNQPYQRSVADNFVGMNAGCFGDSYQITPPTGCEVKALVVAVEKVNFCQ